MNDGHDERFEAFLQREAPEYNRPPAAVPRDEMWAVVARARSTRQAPPARRPWRMAPWIGMAATLLIGIGVGRYALQRDASLADPTRLAGADTTVPQDAQPGTPGIPVAPGVAREVGLDGVPEGARSPAAAVASHTAEPTTTRTVPVRQASRDVQSRGLLPSGRSGAGEPGTAYSVASREHLSRAEALVAVVATMPADAMMDSLMGRWARDVLTNTRLLLDSPAGEDPIRRRLLEDLETLLVQLVQRSGRTVEERDMIDRTLQRTQLLTRLRSGATGT